MPFTLCSRRFHQNFKDHYQYAFSHQSLAITHTNFPSLHFNDIMRIHYDIFPLLKWFIFLFGGFFFMRLLIFFNNIQQGPALGLHPILRVIGTNASTAAPLTSPAAVRPSPKVTEADELGVGTINVCMSQSAGLYGERDHDNGSLVGLTSIKQCS